ncbi:MAG: glycosyltransferase [Spirochaetales bacterium]|jgi:glycosyltransferase involved in cell wall biosynthesis|nr:glycosyltransferase [Spirochaetales bacterium]
MRIAFFLEIFYPEINGVLTATLNLARNLKSLGHHVLLVVPRSRASEAVREIDGIEVFKVPSIPVYIYPGMRFNNPWNQVLKRKLLREKIEILHTTGPGTLALAAMVWARRFKLPLVQTFHTMLSEDTYLLYLVRLKRLLPVGRFISWRYMGKIIRASDFITAPSLFACGEIKKRYPEKPVCHISNGVELDVFRRFPAREEFEKEFPFYNDKTFIFVGRVGLEKSIDTLLSAFAAAASRDSHLRLVVVGDGPSRVEMASLARDLGLENNIFFLGKIPHERLLASGLLQYSRAFITASVTENQPMTIIEAICCSLPIIVADVEGMRELTDGNGLRFPPGDRAALADCILRAAGDDALHGELRAASQRLAARFDGRSVALQFEEEYGKLLTQRA